MNQVIKFLAGLVLVCAALPSVAENLEKGIYADTAKGQIKCLADVAAGTAKWYEPSLDQPVTAPRFTKKTVAGRGACLVRAHVTGDDGNGSQIATVAVPAGFAYAELISGGKTIEMRMAACNNLFKEVLYPPAAAPATTSSVAVTATVTTATPTATVAVGSATNAAAVVVNNNVNVGAAPAAASATCAAPPCVPHRKTEPGEGGWCKVTSGKLECNFPWKVLRSPGDLEDCGCQVRIPAFKQTPEQIVGFKDAEPGSKRCLQQKKIFADAIGVTYSDKRN